jgi:hypothetical protein
MCSCAVPPAPNGGGFMLPPSCHPTHYVHYHHQVSCACEQHSCGKGPGYLLSRINNLYLETITAFSCKTLNFLHQYSVPCCRSSVLTTARQDWTSESLLWYCTLVNCYYDPLVNCYYDPLVNCFYDPLVNCYYNPVVQRQGKAKKMIGTNWELFYPFSQIFCSRYLGRRC